MTPLPNISSTRVEFEELKLKGFHKIPLARVLPLDGHSLWGIAENFPRQCPKILLETAMKTDDQGFSFLAYAARCEFMVQAGQVYQNQQASDLSPVEAFQSFIKPDPSYYKAPGFPPFAGGWMGFLAYEAARFFEKLPEPKSPSLVDDMYFYRVEDLFVVDHKNQQLWLIACVSDYDDGLKRLETLKSLLDHKLVVELETYTPTNHLSFDDFDFTSYQQIVFAIQERIRAGDTYQVNFSQRFQQKTFCSPWEIYKRLSRLSPAPFACYFETADYAVVSASMERLVQVCDRQVKTRPIAGTRRRGDELEDRKFIEELHSDPKEIAEHAMLVDLERNDLGKICEFASVKITQLREIVSYPFVFHIESDITGQLTPEQTPLTILAAMFPGGTITGVPKISTMKIIHELEDSPRGVYTGSLGYVSYSGNMDFNILIRSLTIKEDCAYTSAGSGITMDALPEREYQEIKNKVRPQLLVL